MTINATAPWLLALYIAVAEEQGVDTKLLQGTTQNDLIKEYLSRGTYIFPPARLAQADRRHDRVHGAAGAEVEPDQRLQLPPAGGRGDAGAGARVRAARRRSRCSTPCSDAGQVKPERDGRRWSGASRSSSTRASASSTRCARCARSRALWDQHHRASATACTDAELAPLPLRRAGQLARPDRAAAREQHHPHRARDAGGHAQQERARARHPAAGLERGARPAAAVGPAVVAARAADPGVRERPARATATSSTAAWWSRSASPRWCEQAKSEIDDILGARRRGRGGRERLLKQRLVESNAARLAAIERGEQIVVGVNKYVETAPSRRSREDLDDGDPDGRSRGRAAARSTRSSAGARERDAGRGNARARRRCARRSSAGDNVMPPSIAAAKAGVTTGEWAGALREVLGEYRAPTGVVGRARGRCRRQRASATTSRELRAELGKLEKKLGRRPKMLVGKPGLDGHSNGAEQIALKARDVGFEVVYEGIRVSPERLVASALEEGVHLIGVSILSGSHLELVPQIVAQRARGRASATCRSWSAASSPRADAARLLASGRGARVHAQGLRAQRDHGRPGRSWSRAAPTRMSQLSRPSSRAAHRSADKARSRARST